MPEAGLSPGSDPIHASLQEELELVALEQNSHVLEYERHSCWQRMLAEDQQACEQEETAQPHDAHVVVFKVTMQGAIRKALGLAQNERTDWLWLFHRRRDKSLGPQEWRHTYEGRWAFNPQKELARVSANRIGDNHALGQGPQGFAPNKPVSTPVTLSSPSYNPSSAPSSTTPSNVHRLHVAANQNTKPWARLTEREKLLAMGEAAEAAGAIAVTVHMSARKQATLRTAAAEGKDICQRLADDIVRQCRKSGVAVPAFLFGIEVAPVTSKIHIHGYFVPASSSPDMDQMAHVFRRALGFIQGQHGSTQFDAEPLYTPERWLAYLEKQAGRARRQLGVDKLIHVSNAMRRLGKRFHENRRQRSNRTGAVGTGTNSKAAAPLQPQPSTTACKGQQREVFQIKRDASG